MAELLLHGKPVPTVFHLLGKRENDLTYSLGWALAKSPRFLSSLISATLQIRPNLEKVNLRLQHSEGDQGITDIEIESPGEFFLILEAKCGWNLPSKTQLEKYGSRTGFSNHRRVPSKILALSECSRDYARTRLLSRTINGISVEPISWKQIADIAADARNGSRHAEKRILAELVTYFRSLMAMQNGDSNWVYVVSLGNDKPDGWKLSWIDIVEKRRRYFHPVGGGWPKEPPNYIAFRYRGKLQSIHHVESYSVFDDPHEVFREIPKQTWKQHFIYQLSPPFAPKHEVRTGNLYRNGRVRCMLDTLFLAKTIAEARDMSKERSESTN